MKYTLKIQLKNGGEVSSEPFELPGEPENFHLEAEKKELPKSWVDLKAIKGYFIGEGCSITKSSTLLVFGYNKKVFATEAQANSALAYAQLTQLMKAYNGDWVPNWYNKDQKKHIIARFMDELTKGSVFLDYYFLAFPTEELRDEFMKNFEPLIKTFYQI